MALNLNAFTTQSPKLPSFALPQMASLRSPKFSMASTLRSGAKSVLLLLSISSNPILVFHILGLICGSLCDFLFWGCFWIWVLLISWNLRLQLLHFSCVFYAIFHGESCFVMWVSCILV